MIASPRNPCLFVWDNPKFTFTNFGDHLSREIVRRCIGEDRHFSENSAASGPRLLAVGSILHYSRDDDVVWGSGINGNRLALTNYHFSRLDIRAVRGPLTRDFLRTELRVDCPAVYGDPALLLPALYPEFRRTAAETPFIVIPHYTERGLFPASASNIFFPHLTHWRVLLKAILATQFVISSSLHGIIVAEAFGIPARMLRLSNREHLFKYRDYYEGTGRSQVQFARSVPEAMEMGGMPAGTCDLQRLKASFPHDLWSFADDSLSSSPAHRPEKRV